MKVFVKELNRWEEITPENKEILRKFGYVKEEADDAQDNKRTSKQVNSDTKRTSRRKSS